MSVPLAGALILLASLAVAGLFIVAVHLDRIASALELVALDQHPTHPANLISKDPRA